MPLASIDTVGTAAAAAIRRFPIALASAWACAAFFVAIILWNGQHPGWMAAAFAAMLGLPLFAAIELWSERRRSDAGAPSRGVAPLLFVLSLAGLVAFALQWPHWNQSLQVRAFVQCLVLVHAIAAVLPYVGVREPNGFWQYNRSLLHRFAL
ncbi:MAG: hypothetical protein HOP12_01035 [Candidatus Eisenbacteria bacterium]|uniref:Uncharacterized protein n=1 Tax=Eiseniibacteriota bacterium TaxID=2212470 RepID=A0A849SE19_UNCEI|nr:hypothetical protein [Candidatus Eisenbacteria bacterium]